MSFNLPPQVVTGLRDLDTYQYLQVAPTFILGYDFLLTFSDEIDLMWRREWKISSTFFFINRYLPFVDGIMQLLSTFMVPPSNFRPTCQALLVGHAWLVVLGVNLAECILVLRTYAIWNYDIRVGIGLFTALIGTCIFEGFDLMKVAESFIFIDSPSPLDFPGCFISQVDPSPAQPAYLTLLVFETVVFIITLFKLLRRRKAHYGNPSVLLETLLLDGLASYVMVFGISLINIILLRTLSGEIGNVLITFHRVLHSILATRLVLGLRRAVTLPSADHAGARMLGSALAQESISVVGQSHTQL